MKKEKQILKRRELLGWLECVTFRELGQSAGIFFNVVKKNSQGQD